MIMLFPSTFSSPPFSLSFLSLSISISMTREDDWVQVAMLNDAVVVDLLIQIQQAAPPQIKSTTSESTLQALEWSVRQPRSKPVSVNNNKKLLSTASRSSPTTPLSWSTTGATSFSAGGSADGIEETSRTQQPPPPPPDASRSKVSGGTGTGTTSSKISYKRPRKKKSLGELKEEENLLNKEKRHLKKELAALRMDIEKQRVINENLKRQKVEKQAAVDHEMVGGNSFPFLPDLNIACGEQEDQL